MTETNRNIVEYAGLSKVDGPLIFVENVRDAAFDEMVEIRAPSGELRLGQVLETSARVTLVQVFEGTQGLSNKGTRVRFL
ncbi:MAG: V-type ATP synthase subunit B, partial [Planctomycetota bacterium]